MNIGPLIVIGLAAVLAIWLYLRRRGKPGSNLGLAVCALGMIGGSAWNFQLSNGSERIDFSAALSLRDQACGWRLGEQLRRDGVKQVLILNQFESSVATAWQAGFNQAFGGNPLVRELPACSVEELGLSDDELKGFGHNPEADKILLRYNSLSISRAAEASSAEVVILCSYGAPRLIEGASLSHLPLTALASFNTGDDLAPLRQLLPAGLMVCRPLPVLPQDQGAELKDIAQTCFKLESIKETP